MIRSRLHRRRTPVTVTVKSKAFASGQYSESTLLSGLTATKEPSFTQEIATDAGQVVLVSDVFWFEAATLNGSLPAIEEKHVLLVGSTRYEVMLVMAQGGEQDRLKVMTRKLR